MCSTPSGIGDQIKLATRKKTTRKDSAQRLPASEIKSIVYLKLPFGNQMCSTPSGIGDQIKLYIIQRLYTASGAQRLPASEIKSTFDIDDANDVGAGAQRLPASEIKSSLAKYFVCKAKKCSTPSGIGDQINWVEISTLQSYEVLNAFRHRRSNQSTSVLRT